MNDKFKVIKGTYLVEKKYGLIWLKNKDNETTQTLDYFKFSTLLLQSFTDDQRKVILEHINSDERLVIDFDNSHAKIIVTKDVDFHKTMTKYMTSRAVEEEIQLIAETNPESPYNNF